MIYNELKERGTEDFPIEFYHVDSTHPEYIMRHHWHGELEIIRVLCGSLELSLNNTELDATEDDIIFVNSEVVHGAMPRDCVYECIVFDPEKVILNTEPGKRFADGLINHDFFIFHRIRNEKKELHDAVRSVFDSFQNSDPYYKLEVISGMYKLFYVIMKEKLYSENIKYRDFPGDRNIIKLKKAISYMREHYCERITLDEISKNVGVSPKYCCSFFKQMTNLSPIEYLNVYRIEKSAREIISTDHPVTQIAYSNGFNDLSYFIKTFKRIKGVTPKEFRNTHYT